MVGDSSPSAWCLHPTGMPRRSRTPTSK